MPARLQRSISAYTYQNKVQLIHGGKDYFSLLEWHIAHASRIIFLQTYIFEEDETGMRIAGLLKEASKRGVKVYVMVDGYASQNLSESFLKSFREAGGYIRGFEPILRSNSFYFGRRLHHKIAVIDMEAALVGGINISNRYNDMPDEPAWLDWALYVEGEAACGLGQVCAELWTRSRSAASTLVAPFPCPPQVPDGHCAVRIRRNDWVQRRNEVSRSYLEMFRNASSHIIIMSSYFLPGRIFRRNMARAVNRGVKMKLILAGTSDVPLAKNGERYIYRWLFKNRIEIYEYNRTVLHGKLATYDGKWVTVGSYNVNNISAYASIELNLDVDEPAFAAHTEQLLNRIIAEDCVQVTEKDYNIRYHFFQKMIQKASYDIIRLIFYLFTFYFKQR